MMHPISKYPEVIESKKIALDDAHQEVFRAQEIVDELEAQYKAEAAADEELTNRTKRKAYVEEQKSSDAYQDAKQNVIDTKRERNLIQFALERLQDEFKVKLARAKEVV